MQIISRNAGLGLALAGAFATVLSAADPAAATGRERSYDVTFTNLTKGQVITPPAVIAHRGGYSLFEIGHPASEGLAILAETGNPGPLADEATLVPGVVAVETGADVIPPGQSLTVRISADRSARWLSVAAMLATTNDAFAALHGLPLPLLGAAKSARAVAYDAGSEANNELCDFIPGPPCNDTNQRATAGAEGFVHVHNGVHGGGELSPAGQDWHNPVLEVTVTRVHGHGGDD